MIRLFKSALPRRVAVALLLAAAPAAAQIPGNGVPNGHLPGAPAKQTAAPSRLAAPPALPGAHSQPGQAVQSDRLATAMSPNESLFDAINRGDIADARDAIARGADLGARNVLGLMPIDLSVDLSRNDITVLLLSLRGTAAGAGRSKQVAASTPAAPPVKQPPPARPAAATLVVARTPAPAPQRPALSADPGTPAPKVGFLGFLRSAAAMSIEVDWTHLTGPRHPGAIAALAATRWRCCRWDRWNSTARICPVITDTRTAWEISIRAARLAAPSMPVLVLPGMWTGMSEHHLPFGGTISLNFSEFRGVLAGVTRSLRAIGFGRLLVVNGHGGNQDPLAVAVRELAVEVYEMPVVATTPWFIAQDAVAAQMTTAKGPQHACEAETSVMLAMVPDLVRTDKLEEAMRQAPPSVPGRAGFSRFWSFSERAPVTGVRGDPRPATAAKGEIKLDAMAAALAEAMGDKMLWRTPDPVWSAGRGAGEYGGVRRWSREASAGRCPEGARGQAPGP